MFGLSRNERNFKDAKAYIETQSINLENRMLSFDDGLAILCIGYLELNKIFIDDHREPDTRKIKDELNLYFQEFDEIRALISKTYKELSSKQKLELLENISAFLFVESFFKKDISDLVISSLVQYVEEKFFPNARLLGAKFYGKFQVFGTGLYHIGGYGRHLHAYDDWEQIDRKGYQIEGAIRFYKVFRLLREQKIKSKNNEFKEEKLFLSNL